MTEVRAFVRQNFRVAGAKGHGMDAGRVSDACVRMFVYVFRAGECSNEV